MLKLLFFKPFSSVRRERETLKCTTTYGIITINGTVLVYVVRITIQFSHPHSLCPVRRSPTLYALKRINIHIEKNDSQIVSAEKKQQQKKEARSRSHRVVGSDREAREKSISNCSSISFQTRANVLCVFSLSFGVFFFVETLLNCTQFAFQTSSGGKC